MLGSNPLMGSLLSIGLYVILLFFKIIYDGLKKPNSKFKLSDIFLSKYTPKSKEITFCFVLVKSVCLSVSSIVTV